MGLSMKVLTNDPVVIKIRAIHFYVNMTKAVIMKFKKIILRTLAVTFIISLVLSAILFAHIYKYTHSEAYNTVAIQLARIDFKEKISPEEGEHIKAFIQHVTGVKTALFNHEHGVLVYTYLPNEQNPATVYQLLCSHKPYKAERYTVSAEEAATGCPALGDENSFKNKLTRFIASI